MSLPYDIFANQNYTVNYIKMFRKMYNFWLMTILIIIFNAVIALDLEKLKDLGVQGDFYIGDITVYFNRVFLAIPRTVCENNITNPTLVEIPWKEFNTILKVRINKPIEGQLWAKCDDLQNAVSLAKEGVKSKLWILDRGNEFCPAKIVAYSMLQNTFLTDQTIDLTDVPKDGLTTMVIENGTKFGNHRAFLASAGQNTILVCYLNDLDCDHLKLIEASNQAMPIYVDFLALSETGPDMFLTSTRSTNVFSLDVTNIPEKIISKNTTLKSVTVNYLGDTLGPSSGLDVDLKDGLIYYLTRDYAVVRWIIGQPLQAENHDVLAQSFKRLPYVSRFFTDPQGSVYALVNPFSPSTCEREENSLNNSSSVSEKDTQLERVTKIMKYNRFFEKLFN